MEYYAQDTTRRNRQKPVLNANGVDFPSCRHRPDPHALPDRPRLTLHHHRAHQCASLDKVIVFYVIAYKWSVTSRRSMVAGSPTAQISLQPSTAWRSSPSNGVVTHRQSASGRARVRPRRHSTTLSRRCSLCMPSAAGRASSRSSQPSSSGRSSSALSVLQKALNLSLYNVDRAPRAAPVR